MDTGQLLVTYGQLNPTATGLDGLPAWFLRLVAPAFCKPVAQLFNFSLATSTVPQQWKQASIQPIPKVLPPKQHADFRLISITQILTRSRENTVVRHFVYPALLLSPPALSSMTSLLSTTAAIISPQHHHQHASVLSHPHRHFIGLQQGIQHYTTLHTY